MVGYSALRFLPTDNEVFFDYLMRRLNGESLPEPDIIRDCDVYGGGEPWKIFGKDRDEKFYVFTMLKKKSKSRVDRTAGYGTWKGEQSYKIRGSQGEVVGYKKLFSFKSKTSSSAEADKADNGHWIMYEYSKHPYNDTECVLCVIRNKSAEEARKKMCRNLHGQVQLEEENRQATKARPVGGDRTNIFDVSSAALPPSATAATKAQASASRAFNEDEVAILRSICGPTFLNLDGDTFLNSHPVATTMAVTMDFRRTADFQAFGGANAGPLSVMSMADPLHGGTHAPVWRPCTYSTAIEATLAYDEAARAMYGPCVRLNLPNTAHPMSFGDSAIVATTLWGATADTAGTPSTGYAVGTPSTVYSAGITDETTAWSTQSELTCGAEVKDGDREVESNADGGEMELKGETNVDFDWLSEYTEDGLFDVDELLRTLEDDPKFSTGCQDGAVEHLGHK